MRYWNDYKTTFKKEDALDALFEAARNGDLGALIELDLGPESINQKNHKGHSPLMLAAYHGHYELALALLEMDADPNSRDLSGNTILMGAAFKGNAEIIRLLVQYGARVDDLNPKGQTALVFAQMFGRAEAARYLKSKQSKPEDFGLMDVLSGWSSFIVKKGA